MTFRDQAALAVLAGWGESHHTWSGMDARSLPYPVRMARFAYAVADAMVTEARRLDTEAPPPLHSSKGDPT